MKLQLFYFRCWKFPHHGYVSAAMIEFTEMDSRLEALGKDRKWLAEITERSPDSIRGALAPNAPAKNRSSLLQKALSDAIEAEERQQAKVVPGYNSIILTHDELDIVDQASRLAESPSIAAFCHDVIQGEARRIIAEHAERLRIVEAAQAAEEANIVEGPQHWIDGRGGVAAGSPMDAVNWEPIPVDKEYPSDHYALKVFGRSMEPKIPDGATIIVREQPDHVFPKKGTIVVYSDASGSTLKEFGYRKAKAGEDANDFGQVPVLRSLNPLFKDVQTMEGGRIDAVLVEVL